MRYIEYEQGDLEYRTKNWGRLFHGTTIDNEKGVATGQAQGELSELGKKQINELKDNLKIKKFDVQEWHEYL